MLACDGFPISSPTRLPYYWPGWAFGGITNTGNGITDGNYPPLVTGPVTLDMSFRCDAEGNGATNGVSNNQLVSTAGLDRVRHQNKVNVLCCDGHVEVKTIATSPLVLPQTPELDAASKGGNLKDIWIVPAPR